MLNGILIPNTPMVTRFETGNSFMVMLDTSSGVIGSFVIHHGCRKTW